MHWGERMGRVTTPIFRAFVAAVTGAVTAAGAATAGDVTNVRIHNAKIYPLVFLQETKDCTIAGEAVTRYVVAAKQAVELACRIDAEARRRTAQFLIYNDRKGQWKGQCEMSVWREGPAVVDGLEVWRHHVELRSTGGVDCRERALGEDLFRVDVN